MNYLRWVQILGAAALLVSMLVPRIRPLRPYARRVGLTIMVAYLVAAAAFVIWRAAVGPSAPME